MRGYRGNALLTLIALFLLAPAVDAKAVNPPGVSDATASLGFPEKVKTFGQETPLHGFGTRKATLFGIKVYHAAFYSTKNLKSLAEVLADTDPKRLDIRYVRDFGLEDTNEAWKYQFKESAGANLREIAPEIEKLISFQKPIHEGDVQRFEFRDGMVTFSINDEKRGEIRSKKFEEALLTIFFGPNPPTKELQRGLFRGVANEATLPVK